ncbi:MAG TPA: prepilin-type N-terminal cleavage/methylation domain-containing protein [Thiobacillus sp.]|nr:MAG: type II secretion system protein G [Hydrogenophilales bacterium 28-61-11]OYZ57149.1 MAG: type II secretion system protein G [Hydrogenophilales bacterium 16-61-112]OZA45053.1 MAG: type II secretion system protein G [Hydrogenophilales bacterium 17-61-76]HQT31212.1 prepilin-type N-terminal cleavage/methylation domain-containing protein [Thiobacillus sp.]HQT71971.1 prepilin-type N-terminal cleavage/methylation domain-containing protein [Thiobacillus sp.]
MLKRISFKTVKRGFTLVELMVVMAIIALLLALALPRYFNHLESSRETILKQDLVVMRDAIDKFHGDRGRYPNSLDELVSERYLRALPVDPITERSDTWQVVAPVFDGADAGGEAGELYDVKSGAPGAARDGSAYADW